MNRHSLLVFAAAVAAASLGVGLWLGQRPAQTESVATSESTRAVHRLQLVADQARRQSPYEADAESAAQALDSARTPAAQFRAARQALFAGDTIPAIEALQRLIAASPSPNAGLLRWLSIAYLRLAEQQNCLDRHDAASCILPLAPSAIHQQRPAAENAITTLQARLSLDRDDLEARWLLNLAHMYVGRYPDGVEDELLIPPAVFDRHPSDTAFTDIGEAAGVAVVGRAGGVVFDDFNGDERDDLLVSAWGIGEPLSYFRNDGDNRFVNETVRAGLDGQWGGLNIVSGDYDNDGDLDALVLRGAWLGSIGRHPNSLLENDGTGRFTDRTEAAGLLDLAPTQTAVFVDIDRDGWLDLIVGNESPREYRHFPSRLYRNSGDGTFVGQDLPVNGFVKGVAAGDIDNDGDPDVYLSAMQGQNIMLRNDDGRLVLDRQRSAQVEGPFDSFATWFFDYDNDGDEDLFAAGYTYDWEDARVTATARDYLGEPFTLNPPALYQNDGQGRFSNVTAEVGLHRALLTMGANFADVDNDGDHDLYLGTGAPDLGTLIPNRMLVYDNGRFLDATGATRLGHLQKGHGVAFADFDLDGDLDLYHVLGGAVSGDIYPNALFLNETTNRNWISFRLLGSRSNRSAIGARIELSAGDTIRHRTVGAGGSFGASSLRQLVGLGGYSGAVDLTIRWPSGETQHLQDLAVNTHYRITEGQAATRLTINPVSE